MSPGSALVWFLVTSVFIGLIVWPRRGLAARWRRTRSRSERTQIEDALKHLLNVELQGQAPTDESIARALSVPIDRARALSCRMAERGLVEVEEGCPLRLTESGRGYGLRMLRGHRLLERYFADRTGLPSTEWHRRAEAGEHGLTEAQVETLAARMGNPVFDPHGDPIPTASGILPPSQGVALTSLASGETATVIHVEDEPAEVFDRLVALGIHPAVPVKVLASGASSLDLLVGGRPGSVDRTAADLVQVERVAEGAGHTVLFERLDSLRPGEVAEVIHVAPSVQGPQRRRLLDLGVLPGTRIEAEMRSASGDPMAYRIRGALIALRKEQAQGIYIRRSGLPNEGSQELDR